MVRPLNDVEVDLLHDQPATLVDHAEFHEVFPGLVVGQHDALVPLLVVHQAVDAAPNERFVGPCSLPLKMQLQRYIV